MKTVLPDRTIWFDGMITIEPNRIFDYIDIIDHISVTHLTKDVNQYNKLMPADRQVIEKRGLNTIDPKWTIPDEFKKLDVHEYVHQQHRAFILHNKLEHQERDRLERIIQELKLFEKNNLFPLLQALIYIINKLKQGDEVWGTGRGSSVSSYVLFILEVHDVDSFLYELDIADFIR